MSAAKKKTATKGSRNKSSAAKKIKTAPPTTATDKISPVSPLPIVAIGASAGGLDAFQEFFLNMPEDNGMAFVLIAHLDPNHVSILPELIQKCTKMTVHRVEDGMTITVNSVFIIPPNKDMIISKGVLQLLDRAEKLHTRLPIDTFLKSLAIDQKQNAICIILSGTGSDGTLGIKEIKSTLGMVMAQDEKTAKYMGMPKSAMDTGLVDYILSPKKMPQKLIQYVKHPIYKRNKEVSLIKGNKEASLIKEKEPNTLQQIMVLLKSHTGHDFSAYKQNTICRRIERRMNVHQLKSTESYVEYLQESPRENEILFKELLIGVTNFFRDPDSFEVLRKQIFPKIIKTKKDEYTFRVWVPGCSSGEEVYSIAIILKEVIEATKTDINVQIFGTDIDDNSINIARTGAYKKSIAADVSPERLKRFFVEEDDNYRISKSIREMVVFAPQNIIKDPPFTKLDMISCRNLLIYLNAQAQKMILPLFSYSIKEDGILMLGSSESIGNFTDMFSPLNKKWKIFEVNKSAVTNLVPVSFPIEIQPHLDMKKNQILPLKGNNELNLSRYVEKNLLKNYAPVAIVINKDSDVIFIYGKTGKYLEPASGVASLNLIDMTREGMRYEMASGIRKAISTAKKVIYEDIKVKINDKNQSINLEITPIKDLTPMSRLLLVTIQDAPILKTISSKQSNSQGVDEKHVMALEQELKYTKENLQTTIEELETSNEELKSSNEELQSTNEELQSTNEELETSKEELQSLNEELSTVNSELQGRIEEMTVTSSDMKNLLDSTQIATIFLDTEFHIKRFTPKATDIINLIPSDLGRDISHIVFKVKYDQLVEDAQKVLDTLIPISREVKGNNDSWYASRIMPYRTIDNLIDGVVVVFDDITLQKKATEAGLIESESLLYQTQKSAEMGSWNWNLQTGEAIWSDQLYLIYGMDKEKGAPSQDTWPDFFHSDDRKTLQNAFDTALEENKAFNIDFRVIRENDGQERWIRSKGKIDKDGNGKPLRLLGMAQDITDRKKIEEALQKSETVFRSIVTNSEPIIFLIDTEGTVLLSEGRMLARMDLIPGELVGQNAFEMYKDSPKIIKAMKGALKGSEFEGLLEHNGLNFKATYTPIKDAKGKVESVLGVVLDITEMEK